MDRNLATNSRNRSFSPPGGPDPGEELVILLELVVERLLPERLAVRLERLPHATLADLCARTCGTDDKESRRIANATMAEHDPLPQWAVDEVRAA